MRKSWRLQGLGETCLIAPRSMVSQEEEAAYLAAQLDRWLADPLAHKTVLEIYESIRGQSALLANRLQGQDLHKYVKAGILQAFRRGEFVLMRMPHATILPTLMRSGGGGQSTQDSPPPPAESAPTEQKKENTWVGIEMVDQDGNPVPQVRYVVEMANGAQKTGQTDENGCAQVRDLVPGTYKVSFPDFDGSEWDAA